MQYLHDTLAITDRPFRLMGTAIGVRMVTLQLSDGSLLLYSPVELGADDLDAIHAQGDVAFIVAPNRFHYSFFPQACAAFPDARPLGVAGLKGKVGNRFGLAHSELESVDGLQVLRPGGMPQGEVILFHEASKTLVVSDLVFNLRNKGPWTAFFFKYINGCYNRPGTTRIFRNFIQDKAAFQTSMEEINDLDFARISLSHGDVIETDAREVFREIFGL